MCVRGAPAQSRGENAARIAVMRAAIGEIVRRGRLDPRWGDLDALILPGGYFSLARSAGCTDLRSRVEVLEESGLVAPLLEAAHSLARSERAYIVAGADGPESDKTRGAGSPGGGDQLCVAWGPRSVAGIGRKVFPIWEAYPRTGRYEGDRYVCCAEDYGTDERIITLARERSAVLCACYDMFGVADSAGKSDARARKIQHIRTPRRTFHRAEPPPAAPGAENFSSQLDECIERWCGLLRRRSVSVALAAIHQFEGGSTSFWQRHGIAGASAALGGGWALGAAHFRTLPSALGKSTLAAHGVPARHASQGQSRRAHSLIPLDGFEGEATATPVLVRLFSAP
jgi:hypothetical protein